MQEIIDVKKTKLLNKTRNLKSDGYRLATICALNDLTILYSFEKDEKLLILRYSANTSDTVESISGIYPYAFMYENEIKELFGINIVNINPDFNGHFYKTSVKMPFRADKGEVRNDE